MKLSKKLALVCLVLCFSLMVENCQYIPGLSGNSNITENAKNDKEQREQEQQDKKKQIGELKAELDRNQSKISEEKRKCDEMTKDTIKAGKNPANQPDSPQTFAQCSKAASIEGQVKTIKENLSKAEQELRETENKNSLTPIVEAKSRNEFDWLSLLLLGFAGIAGLALMGILYYILNKKIEDRIERERHSRIRDIDLVKSEQRDSYRPIKQLDEAVKLQSNQLTQIQTAIQSLQRQTTAGGQNFQSSTFNEPPIVYKPEPQFPVAAEVYLNKVSANAQTATADAIGDMLINDAAKGREFLIVRDNELPENLFYAVPNQYRFSTKSDYLNFYQNYYICDNASGGAVWIKSPTTVRRVEGGWKLEVKGELEIRQN